jgi:YidC/Oxa1 family membrane protein insertase
VGIGELWSLIILDPMVNILIIATKYIFNNFGLTIIVLTIIVNLLMYPLTLKQLKASKAMQDIQEKVNEIKKKYPKDKKRAADEQMKLLKESGTSYAGCILPMLIQTPVWIVLYQAILRVMAVNPEDFLNLSQRLYATWTDVFTVIPLGHRFLWMDLAVPDLFLAILTGMSMWVQQKMMTPASSDPQQQAQSEMMQWMMPMMFAFMGLSFPSGLAVYWVTSTMIRVVLQYFATGWGGLNIPWVTDRMTRKREVNGQIVRQRKNLTADDIRADIVEKPRPAKGDGAEDGKSGDKREDSGGSYPGGFKSIRRQSGGSGDNRNKRR